MVFRKKNGELVVINRCDFTTDKLYYQYILSIV